MENQHRKIKGYRELTQDEIDSVNAIKEQGIALQNLFSELPDDVDQRWVDIAETHLQQGLVALTRAVAKPDCF